MKKLVALFLIFTTILFSNELTTQESSVFGDEIYQPKTVPQTTPAESKNLYLSYIKYPKHIYKNQRFEVGIKALITRSNFDRIETKFLNSEDMTPLNPQQEWKKTFEDTYENSYFFKASQKSFVMPAIEVSLYRGKTLIETRTIQPEEISFSQIAKSDERFSNIIAKEFTLVNSKSKQYNNKEALTIIEVTAKDSNLEDFNLKDFEEQGFTEIKDEYPNQSMIYYLVVPIHKKSLIFNYYNTTENRFVRINIPIEFEEELVSTQTDLNPNNSSFEFYKKIAVGVFALILLILFIWKRSYLVLVLFLLALIAFIIFAMPNKTVRLKKDTVIYILPTKNSTIFQKVNKEVVVEQMKKRNGFIKIMFGSDNYIGWVKEKDVSKN